MTQKTALVWDEVRMGVGGTPHDAHLVADKLTKVASAVSGLAVGADQIAAVTYDAPGAIPPKLAAARRAFEEAAAELEALTTKAQNMKARLEAERP
jgi:hypothetical protein